MARLTGEAAVALKEGSGSSAADNGPEAATAGAAAVTGAAAVAPAATAAASAADTAASKRTDHLSTRMAAVTWEPPVREMRVGGGRKFVFGPKSAP